ncbi:hypothetical protein HYU11_04165 [Candidatus Woesearchaeota archaeon]|nr:hypothetical protein [Candidatus Woesearchaeota archaeon]
MRDRIKNNWELIGVAILALLVVFNSLQVLSVSAAIGGQKTGFFNIGSGSSSKDTSFKVKQGGDVVQNVIAAIIPKGMPSYGEDIGVSYDTPEQSINVLANLDRKIPTSQLSADEKTRYINVTTRISCEFCCGAPYVVDPSGRDACGCAHAASFRGLTKYLLKNEPDKWTNEQVLAELTRWKALYYPKNMVEKGVAAVENGIEITPAVLNDKDLLKKIKAGDKSNIGDLPTMVGGC